MAHHNKRWNGKLGGSHQTVIEAAWRFLPDIIRSESIEKIYPGYISSKKSSSGRNSLKIINDKGFLLLSVRGASAHQEIRVFSKNIDEAKKVIAKVAEEAGFHVSYGSRNEQ